MMADPVCRTAPGRSLRWIVAGMAICGLAQFSGCYGKAQPITPAPAMTPEEKKDLEARIFRVTEAERAQRQEESRKPLPAPEEHIK